LMPRIAKKLPGAAGFIMLAPSASHLEDLIVRQTEYINNLDGNVSKQEKAALAEIMVVRDRIKTLETGSGYKSNELFWAPESYWLDLQDYSPIIEMQSEDRPILIVQGGRDYQVDLSEFAIWQEGLADKANARFVMIPELNHMLAFGVEKSAPAEYQNLSEVDHRVGEELADFIFNR
ncbi:MAG: alpha/beta hydrolase, partial [Clostridiales bacterium]|nr:alpha/beta hydrolase [Clostridiales bacterium]